MAINLLSETQLRNAKPQPSNYKLYDGGGLFVLVHPNGSKYFRLKYRFPKKEKVFSIGVYPTVSLKNARDEATKARTLIAQGIDPNAQKKKDKEPLNITFKKIAEEWLEVKSANWSDSHKRCVESSLATNIYPFIGDMPIASIDVPTMHQTLLKMHHKNILGTLHKTKMWVSAIFRYAIATGRCSVDPCYSLKANKDAFKPLKVKHFPAITTPDEFGELIRKIKSYDGNVMTRHGLMLMAYTFTRTKELRFCQWKEINFSKAEWLIPGHRTKSGRDLIVPLSKQAIGVLQELKALNGASQFVFPNERHPNHKPMSINCLNTALHNMGYFGRACGHGFRSSLSTIGQEELGFNPDVVEKQLSHEHKNTVRGAYHRAEYLAQRKTMMQQWADYLDGLACEAG
jgi:integrase